MAEKEKKRKKNKVSRIKLKIQEDISDEIYYDWESGEIEEVK